MRILFDENISPDFATGLKAFGFPVSHVNFELGRGSEDQEIFDYCAEKKWVLLTGDWRMHRNRVQRAAISQARIDVFILTGRGKLSKDELGLFLHRRFSDLIAFARSNKSPFVAGVPQKGKIQRLKGT